MLLSLKFALASIVYLAAGAAIGLLMIVDRAAYVLIPAHTHITLLGWVSMMIFGVGYHLLPVFAGTELHSEKLAEAHFYIQNVGIAGFALAFAFATVDRGVTPLVMGFGALSYGAILLFVYNMLRSVFAKPPPT